MAEHTLFVGAIRDKISEVIPLADCRLLPDISGVYCIANLRNGKCYIGSSVSIRTRLLFHVNALRRGDHHTHVLQNSFKHHGEDAFGVVCLEFVLPIGLLDCEQRWMDATKCTDRKHGYNLNPRADRTFLSSETKRKMSEARRGMKRSPEAIAKTAASQRGRKASEETRRRLSLSHLGNRQTEETKRKIGDFWRGKSGPLSPNFGRKLTPEQVARRHLSLVKARGAHRERVIKPVLQIDLQTNEIIGEFPSVIDAATAVNRAKSGISYACRKSATAAGFKWRFKGESVGEISNPK